MAGTERSNAYAIARGTAAGRRARPQPRRSMRRRPRRGGAKWALPPLARANPPAAPRLPGLAAARLPRGPANADGAALPLRVGRKPAYGRLTPAAVHAALTAVSPPAESVPHSAMPGPVARLGSSLKTSAGDVVFGMEDSAVSVFGLVFGVAAATDQTDQVLVAGITGAFAAAVSMMAGAFLERQSGGGHCATAPGTGYGHGRLRLRPDGRGHGRCPRGMAGVRADTELGPDGGDGLTAAEPLARGRGPFRQALARGHWSRLSAAGGRRGDPHLDQAHPRAAGQRPGTRARHGRQRPLRRSLPRRQAARPPAATPMPAIHRALGRVSDSVSRQSTGDESAGSAAYASAGSGNGWEIAGNPRTPFSGR